MKIRKADPGDTPAIRRFQEASIRELCAEEYDEQAIENWTRTLAPAHYREAMTRDQFLVAEDERGDILAMCVVDADGGELKGLFVAPEATGRGLGKVLVASAEGVALNAGRHRLSLKATLNAVPFYEKLGYRCRGETTMDLPTGSRLSCIAMDKVLKPDEGEAA